MRDPLMPAVYGSLRWHSTMTVAEEAELLRQCHELDLAYERAAALEPPPPATEDEALALEAAEEQSLEYFNRYIAGDR